MTIQDILPSLQAAGLINGTDIRVTPLTGGVSSDILLVESATRFVVKAALEKLRVKDDWFVDVSRNRVEQSLFEYVSPLMPAAIHRTHAAGWLPVVSARSGETEDASIAHLAVATNAGQLKVGSFSRSERMPKWNEVLRIQRVLGWRARFIGAGMFASAQQCWLP